MSLLIYFLIFLRNVKIRFSWTIYFKMWTPICNLWLLNLRHNRQLPHRAEKICPSACKFIELVHIQINLIPVLMKEVQSII